MKHFLGLTWVLCFVGITFGQEAKITLPDPNAWSVKVYRFPCDELRMGFVSRDRGQLHAPAMLGATAAPEEMRKFIRNSSDVVVRFLDNQGIVLPKGSLAISDTAHDVLAVRTLNAKHEHIGVLAKAYVDKLPAYISFTENILEADSAVVRQLVKDAANQADHTALLERLSALAEQGQARHMGTLAFDTRSGQRSFAERATMRTYADGFAMAQGDVFEVPMSRRKVGTRLDLDPVIGADGRTFDLNIIFAHDFLPPTMRWEAAAQSGARRIKTQVTDFHEVELNTATTLQSGMTKLICVWNSSPTPAGCKVMQAAFLTGRVVQLLPPWEDRAEVLLTELGESVEVTPSPRKVQPNDGLPPGMILQRFQLPPDFLTASCDVSEPAVAGDPFATVAERPRGPRPTALDVLEANGIVFPEGASATFSPVTGELIVRNTPENVKSVQEFVEGLIISRRVVVGIAVQVVQADGSLLRRVAGEVAKVADHAKAWQTLVNAEAEGKASFLQTGWLETRSGQRAAFFAGTTYMHTGASTLGRTKRDEGEKAEARNEPANNVLSVRHEQDPVGFSFQVDPVITPDGASVDLSFSVKYDMASPSERSAPVSQEEKVLNVQSPGTDFHKAEVTSALMMDSGAMRLVGMWKPGGDPELEKADVLQAAFIKVDLLEVTGER